MPTPGGVFRLGAVFFPCETGDTHRMSIVADGTSLAFLLDGEVQVSVSDPVNVTNTKFGLFGRRLDTSDLSSWDDFAVVPLSSP